MQSIKTLFNKQRTCDCGNTEFCSNEINCITKQITNGINLERIGTKYKPLTERYIAIRMNQNPSLKGDLHARKILLAKCKDIGFTRIFFYYC